MITRTALSLALAAVMVLPGAAFAQEEHRIAGKAVPADQVAGVQAKCDEMRKGETTSPVAEAAADEPNKEAGREAAADAAVELSSELWTADGTIDLEKLSIEQCSEGNFGLAPN
ncbi:MULTISPECIES: hypothetical protein [unclassified Devosia]|uniref:hypothetical protein n=1 Tax=unclassified Devosia TaxID=196773 RepID=UPI00155648B8|nr:MULTISPECIES: hypothetical protein [unclassified Devosia]